MAQNLFKVLEKLQSRLGIFDESLLIRANTITFINFIDSKNGRKIIKKLNNYKDTHDFKTLIEGGLVKRNLYFSPLGMRDVEAYANLTGLKKCNVLKNALYSVLLISINEDDEIRDFWENEILEKITSIVKAA